MLLLSQLDEKEMDKMTKKEQITNEILSALTHAVGIGLSIWGLVLLILKVIHLDSGTALFAIIIYGVSLICLYLFSTLFHTFYFTKLKRFFQCLDHFGINLLIAGTYTPYCLLVIKGKLGISILIMVWILALGGMMYHLFSKKRKQSVETLLYIIMGWFCILGIKPMVNALTPAGMILLVSGGIIFTVGALIYSLKNLKFAHVIWHLLVIGGTICMFISLYIYL